LPVDNGEGLFIIFGRNSLFNLSDDFFGVFGTGVVTGKDDLGTQGRGNLSHNRPFGRISIATTAYYGNDLLIAGANTVYGFQYILQGIWGMGIINDCGDILF